MDISDRIAQVFPAGPIIDEVHQIGRVPSIEALAARLHAGDVVRVFDRRRWGKSSVARAALARLQGQGIVPVRVALDEYPTPSAAATVLASAFRTRRGQAMSRTRSLGGRLGDALTSAAQRGAGEDAALGDILDQLRPEEITLARVLEAIPVSLAKTGRHGAIAIDEAHVIAGWDPDARASLRAFLARADRRAGIALASSDARAEKKLKRSRVLGYLGEEFVLPPIADDDWRQGLRRRFTEVGLPIDDDALGQLLAESRGHPYCTMLLAKHAAQLAQPFGSVTEDVVAIALPTVERHEAWKLR